jgi:hypothetical protein
MSGNFVTYVIWTAMTVVASLYGVFAENIYIALMGVAYAILTLATVVVFSQKENR